MLITGLSCVYLLLVSFAYGVTGIKKVGRHKTDVAYFIYDKLCE